MRGATSNEIDVVAGLHHVNRARSGKLTESRAFFMALGDEHRSQPVTRFSVLTTDTSPLMPERRDSTAFGRVRTRSHAFARVQMLSSAPKKHRHEAGLRVYSAA